MKIFKIGICSKAHENSFWAIDVRKGIDDAARDYPNLKLIYTAAKNESKLAEQLKLAESLITSEIDLFVLAPTDPKQFIPIVRKANQKNIPVIIFDSRLDDELAKKNNLKFTFIGFNDYKGGFETGKFLTNYLPDASEVAIIEGIRHGSYKERVRGFLDAINKKLINKDIIAANFDENIAYEKTKFLIEKNPKIRAIFCTSDNMALGCLTGLFELNREDIKVCGFDATHAGKLALQKDRLLTTINTNPESMGRCVINTAMEILSKPNQKIEKEIISDVDLITKKHQIKLPKQIIQNRKYTILTAEKDGSEFDYSSLSESLICPIVIGNNMDDELPKRLKTLNADKYILVTDQNVRVLYGEKLLKSMQENKLNCRIFSFVGGEKLKTFSTLNNLANKILSEGITKKSCIIILGGGVVGNLSGFLAAILLRGIKFIHVPTTVMAQTDSTTGGKQAVNTKHGKNLLGTFYEPEFIYIDTNTINTLPKREYNSGMAECIKHGLCQSRFLLKLIDEKNYPKILRTTIILKTKLIEKDPREKNEAGILIYGHTIGHTLEILSNHELNHGEAISIGMVAAARISKILGYASQKLVDQHIKILSKQGLPTKIPKKIKIQDIIKRLEFDKKERISNIPFILLEEVGKVKNIKGNYFIEVSKEKIQESLLGCY